MIFWISVSERVFFSKGAHQLLPTRLGKLFDGFDFRGYCSSLSRNTKQTSSLELVNYLSMVIGPWRKHRCILQDPDCRAHDRELGISRHGQRAFERCADTFGPAVVSHFHYGIDTAVGALTWTVDRLGAPSTLSDRFPICAPAVCRQSILVPHLPTK